jgi:hypothetical protein
VSNTNPYFNSGESLAQCNHEDSLVPNQHPAVIARSWFVNGAMDENGVLIPIALDPNSWSEEDDANRLVNLLPALSHYPVAPAPEAGQE